MRARDIVMPNRTCRPLALPAGRVASTAGQGVRAAAPQAIEPTGCRFLESGHGVERGFEPRSADARRTSDDAVEREPGESLHSCPLDPIPSCRLEVEG